MLKRFAAAWRFLTVFPFPMRQGDDELDNLRRCAGMFPVVGLVLGIGAGAAALALSAVVPPLVAAAVLTAILAFVSGCFHIDGLADSADAMLSPIHDLEKSLVIMRDSRIGAHGAAAMVLLLIMKFACLASLPPEWLVRTAVLVPFAGRAASLFPISLLPYIRDKGLGALFVISSPARLIAWSCLCAAGGMYLAWGVYGACVGVPVWLATALAWVWYLRRRLGGATGDTYGATTELAETAVCLAAVLAMHNS